MSKKTEPKKPTEQEKLQARLEKVAPLYPTYQLQLFDRTGDFFVNFFIDGFRVGTIGAEKFLIDAEQQLGKAS